MTEKTPKSGRERRKHERVDRRLGLVCYLDGQRFDAETVDFSAGGGFVGTQDDIPVGRVVLVSMSRKKMGKGPILIAGHVVRRQEEPICGIGLRWIKCISMAGLDELIEFLAQFLDIFPAKLPLPPPDLAQDEPVGYNFSSRLFYSPKLPAVGPEDAGGKQEQGGISDIVGPLVKGKKPTPPLPTTADPPAPTDPPAPESVTTGVVYQKSGPDGPVSDFLSRQGGRVPVKIPVLFSVVRETVAGTARNVSPTTLAVEARTSLDAGTVRVHFPVSTRTGVLVVRMDCTVLGTERTGDGRIFWDLSVRTLNEGPYAGIWERYVKYLMGRYLEERAGAAPAR